MNAEKFRALRFYLGMTQQEFANLIGVSSATVGRVETGSLDITPRVKAKLAHINIDDGFIDFYERMRSIS
ncbi:helix-turn-helix transcriptional regulator [Cytobacillus sp. FSL M8-0252]|uniref:helix-turn-helix transcriptional regulator n=1 Tax=Cytobacillus TaxID=2675230 RepID=UPI0030FBC992